MSKKSSLEKLELLLKSCAYRAYMYTEYVWNVEFAGMSRNAFLVHNHILATKISFLLISRA